MGSQRFVCISLVQDRRNAAILVTATGVLTIPVTVIAVIATGIIMFVTNESNKVFHAGTKAASPQGHRFDIKGSDGVWVLKVSSTLMSNGCFLPHFTYHRTKESVSQACTCPICMETCVAEPVDVQRWICDFV